MTLAISLLLSALFLHSVVTESIEVDNGLPICSTGKSKCFGELGCVNYTDEWYNIPYRPMNLLPWDRELLNTNFLLFTKYGPDNGEVVSADEPGSIRISSFDVKNPIMFVVHGFIDDGKTPWVKQLIDTILDYQGPTNVIRVDWGAGSYPPYLCAASNARLVGLEVGFFANVLIDQFGAKPDGIHVIGHSLGAHIAGYAAEMIPGKQLGMVIGLDPAGPYYHKMPPVVRLDPTDAKFVQVIHTDGSPIWTLGFGMMDRLGHVDFYPNDGQHQPGCEISNIPIFDITKGLIPAFKYAFSCSHLRSIFLYMDTFLTGIPYVGYECNDYDTFLQGKCFDCGENNTHCVQMGLKAEEFAKTGRKEVPLYFTTGASAPYSKYEYHVRVTLAKPSDASDWIRGLLTFSAINGSLRVMNDIPITEYKEKFYHGKFYDFLLVSDLNPGQVKSIDLQWNYKRGMFDRPCISPFCDNHLYVESVDFSILNHYPESELKKFISHLVPADGSAYADICNKGVKGFTKS